MPVHLICFKRGRTNSKFNLACPLKQGIQMMEEEKVDVIVTALTKLLEDDISLHAVSYGFDKLAPLIRLMGLRFSIREAKEYYDNDELTFLHHKVMYVLKKEGLKESLIFFIKKELLLDELAGTEAAILKREPTLFEWGGDSIVAHLAKGIDKDRLIRLLIRSYDLLA